MTADLPRVLFFTSEVPQSINAGSMQLYRVLRDYPADRLLVMGMKPDPRAETLRCDYETVPLLTYRLACTRWREWFTGLNALNLRVEPQLSRSARRAREFHPQVVVTVMDKFSYYKHAWALARHLSIPFVTITMDDPETFEPAHRWMAGAAERALRRIYRDARLSLGVSREMCEYLEARFAKKSEVFYFGPPEGLTPRDPESAATLRVPDRLTLGYAGTMSLGYREGITALLPSLEATGTRLRVYTRDRHMLLNHPLVEHGGFLRPEELWPAVQAECDAVLLPYSFGTDIARVYRTHFPTKLSEYCWTGLPLFLSGPDYATGVRWGLRHPDAALTAPAHDEAATTRLLRRLRDEPVLRVQLARASVATARAEFDPLAIKRRFERHLRQAAGQP